jgi:hypothetical protein
MTIDTAAPIAVRREDDTNPAYWTAEGSIQSTSQ